MGDLKPKRFYSREKSRVMHARIVATRDANIASGQAAALHRSTDDFELAKLALRKAGYIVFNHTVVVPGSGLIMVGTRPMTTEQVIAHAERFCRWRKG